MRLLLGLLLAVLATVPLAAVVPKAEDAYAATCGYLTLRAFNLGGGKMRVTQQIDYVLPAGPGGHVVRWNNRTYTSFSGAWYHSYDAAQGGEQLFFTDDRFTYIGAIDVEARAGWIAPEGIGGGFCFTPEPATAAVIVTGGASSASFVEKKVAIARQTTNPGSPYNGTVGSGDCGCGTSSSDDGGSSGTSGQRLPEVIIADGDGGSDG